MSKKTKKENVYTDGLKCQVYYIRRKVVTKKKDGGEITSEYPYGAVCVGYVKDRGEEKVFSRGVSICSDEESFSKKIAYRIARKRLMRAAGSRLTHEEIAGNRKNTADFKAQTNLKYHSEYDVKPTEFERKLLEKL